MFNTRSCNVRAGTFPLLPDKAPGEDVFRVSPLKFDAYLGGLKAFQRRKGKVGYCMD